MGTNFDKKADKMLKGMGVSIPKRQSAVKVPISVVKESVQPVKKEKLVLVTRNNPFHDKTPITVESLTELGFTPALREDYIGASDKTFVIDEMTQNGRVSLVYDFSPPGNQGRPALHLYFSANDVPITENLVCFSADTNVGEIKQLISIMESIAPKESRSLHSLENVSQLIVEATKSI